MDKETLGQIADILKEIWETLDAHNKRLTRLEEKDDAQAK